MVSPNVDRILQEVQDLSAAEQDELKRLLDQRCARLHPNKQAEMRQQLVAEGIISHVSTRSKDGDRFRRWQPVPIKGEPLSKTII